MENSVPVSNSLTIAGNLPVMEAFYTIQGEGFHSGTPAYFIRLAGCDVGCVWCDVQDSWTISDDQYIPVSNIVLQAKKYPSRKVVITGGEPCMYDLTLLIDLLHAEGFSVHIETSGAYPLSGNPDWVCVSPKKFKQPLKTVLAKAHELKVIVFNDSDFKWGEENAAFVCNDCILFLQPEYGKREVMMPALVDYLKLNPQWRISLQTHKFIGIP